MSPYMIANCIMKTLDNAVRRIYGNVDLPFVYGRVYTGVGGRRGRER